LPQSKEILSNEVKYSNDGQVAALEILRLDPERLSFADANNTGDEFSYATAVDKVAGMCGIPASKYKLSTGPLMKKDKQRTQSAHLRFDQVSMVPFAKFLSLMQLRWSALQCDEIKLNKVKAEGQPDLWTVDVDFKYYF
jgi:hypothetical protein